MLLTFQPVLSVLFAWAILDETPSALQLGGVALVLAGLLIVTWGSRLAADGGRAGLRRRHGIGTVGVRARS